MQRALPVSDPAQHGASYTDCLRHQQAGNVLQRIAGGVSVGEPQVLWQVHDRMRPVLERRGERRQRRACRFALTNANQHDVMGQSPRAIDVGLYLAISKVIKN